jgi:rhodanese-related sulfurtransferase
VPTYIRCDELVRELEGPTPPILIEALGAAYYADAHLPGAMNVPPGSVDRLMPTIAPELEADIVVYCSGSCDSSHIVARRLELLGYTKVRVYSGGKEEWVEHGLPVERI